MLQGGSAQNWGEALYCKCDIKEAVLAIFKDICRFWPFLGDPGYGHGAGKEKE